MVYFALPVRDSAIHLLCNAAPGLPRRRHVSRTTSRSFLDCTLAKPKVLLQSVDHVSNCQHTGARLLARNVALRRVFAASAEGNVAVEEPAVATGESLAEDHAENTLDAVAGVQQVEASMEASGNPSAQPGQQRRLTRSNSSASAKKAKILTVQKEELIQGAVFTGKVRAVQAYGAFVDIGAFTDGLVHISQLSSNYVRQVQDVVSVGQEVTVRVIDIDEMAGRIGLTMRDKEAEDQQKQSLKENDSEGGSKSLQGEGGKVLNRGKIAGRGPSARGKRDEPQKVTKLQKGQELEGKVKNIIRSGAFVEFSDGEEGFLRGSEISVGGENVPVETLLHVGQEVKVRVLKIERGKVNLTMKPEVDMKSLNKSINRNEDAGASNPFELAFRMANLIGNDTQVASKESLMETSGLPDGQASAEIGEATATVEDKIPEQPVEELVEATEGIDIETEKKWEAAVTPDEEPRAELSDTKEEHVDAAEDKISAEFVEATEEIDNVRELNVEAATIQQDQPPLADDETDEQLHEAADDQIAAELVEAVQDLEKTATLVAESEEPSPSIPGAFALETDSMTTTVSDPVVEPEIGLVTESVVETAVAEQPSTTNTSVNVPTAAQVKELRELTGAGMMECKKALVACESDVAKASEYLRKKGLVSAEKKASRIAAEGLVGSYVHDGRIGVLIEVNCETDFVSRGDQFKELVADMGMQVVACPSVEVVTVEDVPAEFVAKEKEIESEKDDLAKKPPQIREKIVDGRVAKRLAELALLEQPYIRDDKILVKDLVKQTIAGLGEKVQIRRFVRYNLGEGLQKKSTDFAAEVAAQTAATVEAKPAVPQAPEVKEEKTEESTPKVAVSAARVKELREATGAGMMDCKKALAACENNVEKATEFLRKKGLASAEKKAGRVASEGLIGSYIHDGRIGVLIEVNSETDFVARSETFKELVADLAMQVVACPQVQYVSVEDIPSALVEKETEIELGKEDLATKPEAIRGKIVEGRVAKMMAELVLLEQPYIRNDKILVKDLVKQTVATLGENIQVRRFTRFNLGEGIEKRSIDFAAEVAAQTGASA
ncbi:unnamed protein product [Sphagnum troendelagicum]|uniref:Elongation factor Ts, mitochondrial n=1 Tax=Sphagnum troendelagicum TaxID=128251 RepID=A0ABP0UD40_9BRYO